MMFQKVDAAVILKRARMIYRKVWGTSKKWKGCFSHSRGSL